MTKRTDGTDAMVTQLIRLVADLQAQLKTHHELIQSQAESLEMLGAMVMRQAGSAWVKGPNSYE